MSHAYPIAKTAKAALQAGQPVARTRYEAEAAAEGLVIAALETEWLTPAASDLAAMLALVEASDGHGFVQRYEDAQGNTVLAVTYWKLAPPSKTKPKSPPKPKAEADHTDDLYFRSGRTKKPKRKPIVDPNQLDMFGAEAEGD